MTEIEIRDVIYALLASFGRIKVFMTERVWPKAHGHAG
jgi:hypothetical protein